MKQLMRVCFVSSLPSQSLFSSEQLHALLLYTTNERRDKNETRAALTLPLSTVSIAI